jgi:chromate transporter
MSDDRLPGPRSGAEAPSFREALRTWARIGLLGFGGPAGQIALMHRILVEEKRWVSEARFLHALNYCMLLPGPEAQQLATYVGWLLHRTAGAVAAGTLFVLPGAAVVLVLSALYAELRDLRGVEALFFGLKAAVLAVVVEAVLRIGRRALRSRVLVAIAALAFAAIFLLQVPFPAIVAGAAALGLAGSRLLPGSFVRPAAKGDAGGAADAVLDAQAAHTRPSAVRALRVTAVCGLLWFAPIAAAQALLGPAQVYTQLGVFFSKAAVVTFGGAYAVLAYLAQAAVETHGWLAPGEMLDGLGLAETTPGPLILVTQFVGFLAAYRYAGLGDPLLAGVLGAALTTWVTFVPCFLWILLGAPFVETLRGRRALDAALAAITAAVVGVILNLALWFALHVTFASLEARSAWGMRVLVPDPASLDPASLAIAVGALVALLRLRVGMLPTLGASALAGAAWRLAAGA